MSRARCVGCLEIVVDVGAPAPLSRPHYLHEFSISVWVSSAYASGWSRGPAATTNLDPRHHDCSRRGPAGDALFLSMYAYYAAR